MLGVRILYLKKNVGRNFFNYVNSETDASLEKFDFPKKLESLIIFTGQSASTKKLIDLAFKLKQENKPAYLNFMTSYNNINLKLKNAFLQEDLVQIKLLLEKSWEKRKALGEIAKTEIESNYISELIKKFKKNGALTAGLVGAGGGDSILAIFQNKDKKNQLANFARKNNLIVFDNINTLSKKFIIQQSK